MTKRQTGKEKNLISSIGRGKKIFSSLEHEDWIWDPKYPYRLVPEIGRQGCDTLINCVTFLFLTLMFIVMQLCQIQYWFIYVLAKQHEG